jgi:hypothetical protein
VNKQITDHLESHRTFSTMQSVFRAGQGCTSATLIVLNDIITTIDKQYCAAVFIDLAKAFDAVNHRILISRLNSLGISRPSGSLYGGATGFNSQADFFLCIYQ